MTPICRLYIPILVMLLSSCVDLTTRDTTEASQNSSHSDSLLCVQAGAWIDPVDHSRIDPVLLFKTAADSEIVLLGESHTFVEHHRWQLHSIAALYAHQPSLVLGFEMFPRSVQSVLDQWVDGDLNEQEFLEQTRWDEVWRYDPGFYLPLFHFARQNKIPMTALNVERSLVKRVSEDGWAAVPVAEREGVGDPAPVSEAYQDSLAKLYLLKQAMREEPEKMHNPEAMDEPDRETIDAIQNDTSFQHFVQAQSTWDRAMAEGLVEVKDRYAAALAVGVMGRGHVEYGYGVANQLNDLGIEKTALWLPVEPLAGCDELDAGIADAVFIVPAAQVEPTPQRQLLGVSIEAGEKGVKVLSVAHHSVALEAGIEDGDVIAEAAGLPVREPSELIEIIHRQAPGTWLPLKIIRDNKPRDIVAKFPVISED